MTSSSLQLTETHFFSCALHLVFSLQQWPFELTSPFGQVNGPVHLPSIFMKGVLHGAANIFLHCSSLAESSQNDNLVTGSTAVLSIIQDLLEYFVNDS